MAEQLIKDNYALYLDDCCEVLPQLPDGSIHFSIYSPPFAGLYHYSSSPRDLSNSRSYDEFMEHYGFVIGEIARLTLPGRMTAVHCMDIPSGNSGHDHLIDFPGDVIRLHEQYNFRYTGRHCIWKEPLGVRNRTLAKRLAHRTIVDDSTLSGPAGADYLLIFRQDGDNPIPVAHPYGLKVYAGERKIPSDILRYQDWDGAQIENRYSHWIWRQYASAFWDDIRLDRVLPFRESKEEEDEKHVHPLQLDVIDRALILYSNLGETVLTPFMGVGSESYAAVQSGRRAIGIELKETYYRQAVKNMDSANGDTYREMPLFAALLQESEEVL